MEVSNGGGPVVPVLRRKLLDDLKIPAWISQAQASLRRDLHLVREFAGCVGCVCFLSPFLSFLFCYFHCIFLL
jgi:hypothetical protein